MVISKLRLDPTPDKTRVGDWINQTYADVAATGKTLGTFWDAVVQFVQGSGTAITAIDVSTNGGTTYTNLLTQASAALPAGFDQTIGPLRSDSLIKVTFTGTQPTINLYPANT